MAYYMISEYWGEVPIVENSTEIVVSNDFFLPKHTRGSVLEFIRRDLEFASQNLPASDTPGRVTKWSALGLLAKLHLTIASDLPADVEEDRVSAMSAAMLSLGERIASELGRGTLDQVYIRGDNGYVILMSIGEDAVLTSLARKGAKLGLVFLDMRRAAADLRDLL